MTCANLSDIRQFSRYVLLAAVVCLFFGFSAAPAVAGKNHLKSTTVVVFGDSLSAALGIDQQKGWVHLLQKRLSSPYFRANVFNASISGETSQGGLSRIAQVLDKHKPDIVLLELGGNDGLQGLPITLMQDNLERIVQTIQARHIKILLLGIHLPPNYGKYYTQEFDNVYKELAKKYKLPFVPFLLEGIATDPDLMQNDGIHPKAEAQSIILDNVWPYLKPMLPQRKLH